MTVSRRAFTLLEVVVSVVIVALLASVTAPVLFRHVADARVSAAKSDLSTISLALEAYALHMGDYPTTTEGLAALTIAPGDAGDAGDAGERWRGPYLKGATPRDPWGRDYIYEYAPPQPLFRLTSRGRDGRAGGAGEDADIDANGAPPR